MLFEKRSVIASPIDEVFALVADIANAPNIHPMITKRERLDSGELDRGSMFRYYYSFFGMLRHFDFEISEFCPEQQVVYRGTAFFGIIPQFEVHFREIEGATEIHYLMNPEIPAWMAFFIKPMMIQVGNRDLEAYFHKLKLILEPQH